MSKQSNKQQMWIETLSQVDPVSVPIGSRSPLFDRLCAETPILLRRAPPQDDARRWHHALVGQKLHRFAQPLTFTPYASARPCSARCRFCSETLRPEHGGTMAARLRPSVDYFATLKRALSVVRGVPMSWSLSGLEATDDEIWFLELLDTLVAEECAGAIVHDRVLYTNGAGLSRTRGGELIAALKRFGVSWVEMSRHHPDTDRNQAIMRFRDGEPVASTEIFARTAGAIAADIPLKLVCILQRKGIQDADGVWGYLHWAEALGASAVIFREFSRLDATYQNTTSRRYIDGGRVSVESVLMHCMSKHWWASLVPQYLTEGYYFWNLVMRTQTGMEVTFEVSDYAAMRRRHDAGDIYKLVFYANGNLCAGWEPDRNIVWCPAYG